MYDNQHEESDDGEAWLTSYADMISLLLCFFIILYNTGEVDQNKAEEIEKQLMGTFVPIEIEEKIRIQKKTEVYRAFYLLVSLLGIDGNDPEVTERIEKYYQGTQKKKAAKTIAEEIIDKDMQGLKEYISEDSEKERTTVLEFVLPSFAFKGNEVILTKKAKNIVKDISKVLSGIEELVDLEIIAFSDKGPSPNRYYPTKFALASARAGSVAEELVKYGLGDKIRTVSGMGTLRNLYAEINKGQGLKENRKLNRRVHIRVKVNQHEEPEE